MIQVHDVVASRSVEAWSSVNEVEVHSIAIPEIWAGLDYIVNDWILDSPEMLELAHNRLPFPGALRRDFGELPLATAT